MFGLFHRTYDHFEWDDLVSVSTSRERLVEKYHSLEPRHVLIANEQYAEYRDDEHCHFAIVEIDLID